MHRNDDWPTLTFFHKVVTLFVADATLIGLFVLWQFIQAKGNVTITGAEPTRRHIDMGIVEIAYKEKGKNVPPTVRYAVNRHYLEDALAELDPAFSSIFYECPSSAEFWDLLLEGPDAFQALPFRTEEPTDELFENHLYEFIFGFPPESIEARRPLLEIVRDKFEDGEPRDACAISLTLAMARRLNENELSTAADALKRGEYVIISVSVRNDGNAVARKAKVAVLEPWDFQCESAQPEKARECGPFDIEADELKTVHFRAYEPSRLADKSDRELASMFHPDWEKEESPDQLCIVGLLFLDVLFVTAIVAKDVVDRSRARTT